MRTSSGGRTRAGRISLTSGGKLNRRIMEDEEGGRFGERTRKCGMDGISLQKIEYLCRNNYNTIDYGIGN